MAYDIDKIGQGGLLRRGEPANTLIVVIHGLRMDTSQWLPLLRSAGVDPEFTGCDFYVATYPSGLRSHVALEQVGGLLANSIDLQFGRNDAKYSRVILIG